MSNPHRPRQAKMYKYSYLKTICDDTLDELLDGKHIKYGIRLSDNIYMRKKDNATVIGITWYWRDIINLHFGKHFQELTTNNKIFVLKHECVHIADFAINGIEYVLNQDAGGHGKTFQELCKKIGLKFCTYIDFTATYFDCYKQKLSYNYLILKNSQDCG